MEVGEDFSDWGYYSDDYYDQVPGATTLQSTDGDKAKLGSGNKRKRSGQPRDGAKRRRLDHTGAIPEFSLGESLESSSVGTSSPAVVRWKKNDTFTASPLPLIADDEGEKVALLKDWRDRFKLRPRDNTKESQSKPAGYEVPVMKGGVLVIERENEADSSKDACDSATGVKTEQRHAESTNHTSPKTTCYDVPVMKNGVVVRERGVHPIVPSKPETAVNGAQSKKLYANTDEDSDPRQTKRKAVSRLDAQTLTPPTSIQDKSRSRKRRLESPPEPIEETGIALRNQEAIQHNLQHDAKAMVPLSAEKSEKLSEAGKENGGLPEALAARRSKRAKQGS